MGSLSDLTVKIGADLREFSKGMQNVRRDMKKVGASMKSIGKSMSLSLTAPLLAIGILAVTTFADFEQSMAKVKAVSGATATEFKSLNKLAKELGATTRFSAIEVAGLELNLSKLGFSTKGIKDSASSILQLSQAIGEDLAQSATVAASTLRGFGLDVSQMNEVADLMADSFSSTALDLEKFSTSMAVVAPVAKKAGASLAQTTSILGTLVNRGVDASSAGAALRNIFLDLADKGLTWKQAMDKVKKSLNPLKTSMELFGKRGATVATIIANNREEITGLTEDFIDSAGEAKRMADIMDGTLSGSFAKLKSVTEAAQISIGEALVPVIQKMTSMLTKAAVWLNGLSDSAKRMTLIIGGIVAAAGPVLIVLGAIASAIAAISLPMVAVIAGFAALSVAIASTAATIKDESQALEAEKAGLNSRLKLLKKGNLSDKQRSILISEINKKYAEYLPNLISEKTTVSELNEIQKKANSLLLEKIFQKKKEIEITKLVNEQADNFIKIQRLNEKAISVDLRNQKKRQRSFASTKRAIKSEIGSLEERNDAIDESLLKTDKEFENFLKIARGKRSIDSKSDDNANEKLAPTLDLKSLDDVGGGPVGEDTAANDIQKRFDLESALLKNKNLNNLTSEKDYNSQLFELNKNRIDGLLSLEETGSLKYVELQNEKRLADLEFSELNLNLAEDQKQKQLNILEENFSQQKALLENKNLSGLLTEEEFGIQMLALSQNRFDALSLLEETNTVRHIELQNQKLLADQSYTEAVIALEEAQQEAKRQTVDKTIGAAKTIAGSFKKAVGLQKIVALGEIAINTARGISGAIASGSGVPYPGNLVAIATGVASVVSGISQAKSALSKVPAFEFGGLVNGPTLGLIGEGRGTTRSNPEVVSPLNTLKKFMGGGAGGKIELFGQFRIEGSDLVLALDQAQARQLNLS